MFLLMVLLVIFVVAVVAAPTPAIVARKSRLYFQGLKYLLFALDLPKKFNDTNFIAMPHAPTVSSISTTTSPPSSKRVIRVVFVRHGQSLWNSVVNQFGLGWPNRVVRAWLREVYYFFTNPNASCFIDSPLSSKGIREAEELRDFVRTAGKGKVPFDPMTSVVVCSNLRRAMETAIIGLGPRVSATREKILMDSNLQEGSRNIDAISLSSEKGKIANAKVHTYDTPLLLQAIYDPRLNRGNKDVKSNVYKRHTEFVKELFGEEAGLRPLPGSTSISQLDLKEVICVGHSSWFKCFFKRFLPDSSQHVSKSKKMQTGAMVAFNLIRDEKTNEISIDEKSIEVLFKGFSK